MLSHGQLVLRILLAAGLGAALGVERHFHDKPAGLRTHLLVALAAAVFMVVSTQFVYWQPYGSDDPIKVDPSRIAASIVSGIGFLAGGAILRTGVSVHGMATAAGLWVATAVGMAAGAGMFVEAAFVSGVAVIVLALLRRLEQAPDKRVRYQVEVASLHGDDDGDQLTRRLADARLPAEDVSYEKQALCEGPPVLKLTFKISLPAGTPPRALLRILESDASVRSLKIAKET